MERAKDSSALAYCQFAGSETLNVSGEFAQPLTKINPFDFLTLERLITR